MGDACDDEMGPRGGVYCVWVNGTSVRGASDTSVCWDGRGGAGEARRG